jgi:hypothetical protein
MNHTAHTIEKAVKDIVDEMRARTDRGEVAR